MALGPQLLTRQSKYHLNAQLQIDLVVIEVMKRLLFSKISNEHLSLWETAGYSTITALLNL